MQNAKSGNGCLYVIGIILGIIGVLGMMLSMFHIITLPFIIPIMILARYLVYNNSD